MFVKIDGEFSGDVFEGNIEFKKASDSLLGQFSRNAMPSLLKTVFSKFWKNLLDDEDIPLDKKKEIVLAIAIQMMSNSTKAITSSVDDFLGEISNEEDGIEINLTAKKRK